MRSHPFLAAVEARDYQALVDTLAPDVVFHSPLISSPFEGKAQVSDLFRVVTEEILFKDELEYTHECMADDTLVVVFRSRVAGKKVEGVDVMKLDGEGKLRDITVFLRPLTGTAAVASVLSPRLGGRGNRARERMVRTALSPLLGMTRLFDSIAARETARL
jgi:SnoaL-like domain